MKEIGRFCLLLFIFGILLVGLTTASAQGVGFSIPWWTVDGGGATSSAGNFTLSGTIGQPDAGVLAGGSYILSGGFWSGEAIPGGGYALHLPLILRNP